MCRVGAGTGVGVGGVAGDGAVVFGVGYYVAVALVCTWVLVCVGVDGNAGIGGGVDGGYDVYVSVDGCM